MTKDELKAEVKAVLQDLADNGEDLSDKNLEEIAIEIHANAFDDCSLEAVKEAIESIWEGE